MADENVLFEIVVGTYEKFLLGYQFILNDSDDASFNLASSFSNEAHIQSIKCVASNEKYLVSGSTDETIQLFNMKRRQEVGSILHHNGTITSLEFFDTFLLSSSEDGTIIVWTVNNWQCAKTLSGHKKAVNDISIHPSGKLAISVSKDKSLRTWNLIKGRSAYVSNIKKDADTIQWSPNGNLFVTVCSNILDVYSTENGGIIHSFDFEKKICAIAFISEDICAVGGEAEKIIFFDVSKGTKVKEFKAHSTRVKAMNFVDVRDEKFLITVSSDGHIKVWHFNDAEMNSKPSKVAEINTMSRPTCMTVIPERKTTLT